MSHTGLLAPGQTFYGPSATIPTAGTAAGSYATLQKTGWEGLKVELPDQDTTFTKRSGATVTALIVRNVSGISLMGGLAVRYKAGYRFRQVDGYSNVLGGQVAGIVDPHLTSVRDGDLFLLYVNGPCLVRVPLTAAGFNSSGSGVAWVKGGTIVDGDILMAQTGVLTGNTVSGTTADGGGHLCAWNATGGLTCTLTESTSVAPAMASNKVGRVMSALTTAETTQSQRVLVSLEWLPMP